MTSQRWQLNWDAFVKFLASSFNEGMNSAAVAAMIANHDVSWAGVMSESKLNSKFLPTITMEMPKVQIILSGGKLLEGEHLALPIKQSSQLEKCKIARPGDLIEFRAKVFDTGGVFPPFEFIDDDEQQKVFFSMLLKDVEIVRVSSRSKL